MKVSRRKLNLIIENFLNEQEEKVYGSGDYRYKRDPSSKYGWRYSYKGASFKPINQAGGAKLDKKYGGGKGKTSSKSKIEYVIGNTGKYNNVSGTKLLAKEDGKVKFTYLIPDSGNLEMTQKRVPGQDFDFMTKKDAYKVVKKYEELSGKKLIKKSDIPVNPDKPFHPPVEGDMKVSSYPREGHNGVDIEAVKGAKYYAVYDGVLKRKKIGGGKIWSENYSWYRSFKGFGKGEKNIVYQAFPGLKLHIDVVKKPDKYSLFSGPKGLEKFWDKTNQKFTGTIEDIKKLVAGLPNASKYIEAAKPTGKRTIGNKYGHSGLEHALGGDSITLEFEDPAGGTTEIYYAHMAEVTAEEGPISKGDVIGTCGMSGRTTGPHVHLTFNKYKGKSGVSVSNSEAVARDFLSRVDIDSPKLS